MNFITQALLQGFIVFRMSELVIIIKHFVGLWNICGMPARIEEKANHCNISDKSFNITMV